MAAQAHTRPDGRIESFHAVSGEQTNAHLMRAWSSRPDALPGQGDPLTADVQPDFRMR
jgi:hypothetical protein